MKANRPARAFSPGWTPATTSESKPALAIIRKARPAIRPGHIGRAGADTIKRASSSGRRGKPTSRASTLTVPNGSTPIGVDLPASPFTTAWTVPSPPAATMASKSASASRASRSASPGRDRARRRTTPQPCRSSAMTKRRRRRSADRARPAAGLTMIRMRCRTTPPLRAAGTARYAGAVARRVWRQKADPLRMAR